MPAPVLTGNPAVDTPALQTWLQSVEQRLGGLTNDGSGNAPLAPVRGSLVTFGTTKSVAGLTNGAPTFGAYLPFDTKTYDTDGCWSAANPTRLTVPAGVSKVCLLGCMALGAAATDWLFGAIDKNGASGVPGLPQAAVNMNSIATQRLNLVSAVVPVTPGDYFALRAYAATTGSATFSPGVTWFSMEIVG